MLVEPVLEWGHIIPSSYLLSDQMWPNINQNFPQTRVSVISDYESYL